MASCYTRQQVTRESCKIKDLTRAQRERVGSDAFSKEATKKAEEVEEALEEVNNAELPFLKGIEVLPLKEAVSNIASSEMAADAVQKAVSEARTYVASRALESRRVTEAILKSTLAAFRKQTGRINVSAAKLSAFRRETESRRRAASMQEASRKVASAKAALPFAREDLGTLSAETATEICEKLAVLERAAQSRMEDAKSFLTERQKDVKGYADQRCS